MVKESEAEQKLDEQPQGTHFSGNLCRMFNDINEARQIGYPGDEGFRVLQRQGTVIAKEFKGPAKQIANFM